MTPFRLRVLTRARTDLLEIKAWLTQPGSGRRAWARYASIVRTLVDLKTAWRSWPEGDHRDIRERPVEGYRVYYRVDTNAQRAEVLRIFGPGQDRRV